MQTRMKGCWAAHPSGPVLSQLPLKTLGKKLDCCLVGFFSFFFFYGKCLNALILNFFKSVDTGFIGSKQLTFFKGVVCVMNYYRRGSCFTFPKHGHVYYSCWRSFSLCSIWFLFIFFLFLPGRGFHFMKAKEMLDIVESCSVELI